MIKRKNRILAICMSACLFAGMSAVFTPRAAAFEKTRPERAITAPAGPAVPEKVMALSEGVSAVRLSWAKAPGAVQYQVYRYNSKTGVWRRVKTTAALSARFTGLAEKAVYRYKVRAVSDSGKSACSRVVSVRTGIATRVSLNSAAKKLYVNDIHQLKVSVTAGAPSKKVAWSSSNQTIASVSQTGTVKALKPGTAVITARAHNGTLASAKIRVVQSSETTTPPADSENLLQPNTPSKPENPPHTEGREYKQRYNREMLRLVNNFRKSRGRKALTYNTKIQKAADTRAREAIRRPELGHKRYDKKGALKSFSSVFSDLNLNIRYSAAGENLAWRSYQSSPEAAALALFNQWKNSPGHRVNMLDSAYTSMTTAIAYDRNRTGGYQYSAAAVQLFLR